MKPKTVLPTDTIYVCHDKAASAECCCHPGGPAAREEV